MGLLGASLTTLFLFGCGNEISPTTFPIHNYPPVPDAISQPHNIFIPCAELGAPANTVVSQMVCVDEGSLLELQSFIRSIDAILMTYEYTLKRINQRK